MALELVAELIGTPLLDAVRRHHPRFAKHTNAAMEWLREVAEPPDGVVLKSSDGSTYTGMVVVERNELVMMLAFRHPPGRVAAPVITPAPRPVYQGPVYEPEDRWDRNGDPYLR